MTTRISKITIISLTLGLLLYSGWQHAARPVPQSAARNEASRQIIPWRQVIATGIPLLGHRNWIVIVDSAYPLQSNPGIETFVSNADQLEVVQEVLKTIGQSKHVRPNIYTDAELKYIPEQDAPGIGAYRDRLKKLFGEHVVNSLPHEEIISKLDEAGKTFRIVIIKTNMTLPYTSVFLQLDCKYWSAEAEQRLRKAMEAQP